MNKPLLHVIDDLVPPELHIGAWQACMGKHWYFGHTSSGRDTTETGQILQIPFWKMDLEGVEAIDAIWAYAKPKCEKQIGQGLNVIRQYANGHTYGQGGSVHIDEKYPGFYTLLYYPMPKWEVIWEGETVYYYTNLEVAAAVKPKPNRAVLFDSRFPHHGRPPSRYCSDLRVTIGFKLVTDEAAADKNET